MIPDEGDPCRHGDCEGVYYFPVVENCSCHIDPPCMVHENIRLTCSACGDELG